MESLLSHERHELATTHRSRRRVDLDVPRILRSLQAPFARREHGPRRTFGVTMRPAPSSGAGGQVQLTLFNPTHPVVEQLRLLDVDRLSPLEALNTLSDLKRRIGNP